jgi:hypothetical protein
MKPFLFLTLLLCTSTFTATFDIITVMTKVFVKDKEVTSSKVDPMRGTTNINESNSTWPKVKTQSKFADNKIKQGAVCGGSNGINPMQKAEEKKKKGF